MFTSPISPLCFLPAFGGGRGGRARRQMRKKQRNERAEYPISPLTSSASRQGQTALDDTDLNQVWDWLFELDSSLEVYRSCALWRDRKERFSLATVEGDDWWEIETLSNLHLTHLRQLNRSTTSRIQLTHVVQFGALWRWPSSGLGPWLSSFIYSLIHSADICRALSVHRKELWTRKTDKGPVLWEVKFQMPEWFRGTF